MIKRLQEMIDGAQRLVFFGGAGVSTECGIPDFRSDTGLYAREYDGMSAEMLLSTSFFHMHPDRFYAFYRKYMLFPDAVPGIAHRQLAALEKAGVLRAVITQNIDGLDRMAGTRAVYALHGDVHENRCMDCGALVPFRSVLEGEGVPRCPRCQGPVRPMITLYGEMPDPQVMAGACRELSRADTLIVAGTSLQVEPAASCLSYFRGSSLAVINLEKTAADERADLVLHMPVGEVLGKIKIPPARTRKKGAWWE